MKMSQLVFMVCLSTLLIFSCNTPGESPSENSNDPGVATDVKGQGSINDGVSAKNILQVAIESKDHTTLVAAVQAVGLEDVLANNGPLTVFAPTNAAFDELPAGTVDNLLKPENKDALTDIIWFHASPGKYMGDLLKDGMSLYQASGHYVKVAEKDGKFSVHGSNILATVEVANGVVHVVDKVMLPPE